MTEKMDLFFTPGDHIDLQSGRLNIEGDEFHHIVRVLRRKSGETILVTDGQGFRCEAVITGMGKKSLEAEIRSHYSQTRPATEVAVAFSLLKAHQRFDFFLEKAVELGVSAIIPMITARTVSQPSNEKIEGKLTRWGNIVLSAAKQSKRVFFPRLEAPLHFRDILGLQGYDNRLLPYEGATAPPDADYSGKKTIFLIGGEGGFTTNEVECARTAGFRDVSLGKTILRAETAAIFSVAMVRGKLLEGEREKWL